MFVLEGFFYGGVQFLSSSFRIGLSDERSQTNLLAAPPKSPFVGVLLFSRQPHCNSPIDAASIKVLWTTLKVSNFTSFGIFDARELHSPPTMVNTPPRISLELNVFFFTG